MTANAHTTTVERPTSRRRMEPMRRIALTAGVLYLLTFVSIPTLALYQPVKSHVDTFVAGAGSTTGLQWGALSEVIVGVAGIGTAVVLYPVTRRVSQSAALGLVAARVLETTLIFVGVISILTITTLRTTVAAAPGADPSSLVTIGYSLVAVYNWTFLVSQSLMPVACDLLLGYILYRSALVPRILPIVAFIGAPLLLASDTAVFFGAYAQVSPLAALAALPVAAFEFCLGVWLVVKGFSLSSPLMARSSTDGHSPDPAPSPRTAGTTLDKGATEVGVG